MYYKRNKECNTNNNHIVIDLINNKHENIDNPETIRVNYFVWEQWKEFTKKNNIYSSKDPISMALKEYIQKYK